MTQKVALGFRIVAHDLMFTCSPPCVHANSSQSLPVVILVLMGIWMGSALTQYVKAGDLVMEKNLAGFSWAYADGRVFNWHPLLMTFGFVFCSMQAALAYISLPFSHDTNKRIHLSLHALGFVSAVVGAVAVFRFHNEHSITNLYSLHSWLGLLSLILFSGHYLVSFIVFFYPGARRSVRAEVSPFHIGLGIGILGLVSITVATGILEKLSFNASCNVAGILNGQQVNGYMALDCVLGNTIGLLLAITFAALVVTIYHAKHTPQSIAHGEESVPLIRGGPHKAGTAHV